MARDPPALVQPTTGPERSAGRHRGATAVVRQTYFSRGRDRGTHGVIVGRVWRGAPYWHSRHLARRLTNVPPRQPSRRRRAPLMGSMRCRPLTPLPRWAARAAAPGRGPRPWVNSQRTHLPTPNARGPASLEWPRPAVRVHRVVRHVVRPRLAVMVAAAARHICGGVQPVGERKSHDGSARRRG